MSKNMSSTSQRYEDANKKFNEAYDKYAGQAGYKLATENAQQLAEQQSGRAGARAGQQAEEAARTSGLSKGRSAMLASKAASDASAQSYDSMYNTGMQGSLSSSQNAVSARGNQMGMAQQEGQNQYNRAWGNVGGIGSMVTGLLTSDERLKEAECVSGDCKKEDDRIARYRETIKKLDKPAKDDSWALLKVTYTKKKENE